MKGACALEQVGSWIVEGGVLSTVWRIGVTMDLTGKQDYYLEAGYIYFSKSAVTVRTVVGSCVTVCLWDRRLKYGGINHFLRPRVSATDDPTAQFGNVAIITLMRIMQEAGCSETDIVAQILGGGFPEDGKGPDIGAKNVAVAREILGRRSISVISEDVGGSMGRKIVFDTGTGQCVVLKVHSIRESDWGLGN